MVDITSHVQYWRVGAEEDMQAAKQLIEGGKNRHGLFFVHLALEKILKAGVCKVTNSAAPRIHNLVRLAQIGDEQLDFLADMNEFNLEGRYPVAIVPSISQAQAFIYLAKAQEMILWLMRQL